MIQKDEKTIIATNKIAIPYLDLSSLSDNNVTRMNKFIDEANASKPDEHLIKKRYTK